MVSATLISIHNERFVVKMVDDARLAIEAGNFFDFKAETWAATTPLGIHSDFADVDTLGGFVEQILTSRKRCSRAGPCSGVRRALQKGPNV